MLRELPDALRALRRTPTFTAAAVVILSVAIGMTAAMVTVFDAVLVRELPVRDQDRLVVLRGVGQGATAADLPITLAEYRAFRDASRTLDDAAGVAYFGASPSAISEDDRPLALKQARVTGNFFQVLGVTPVLGRTLQPEDDIAGAAPVMVISYNLWRGHFGGDSSVIGRRLKWHATGWSYTIVGVAPAGLDCPVGADYWVPIVPTLFLWVDVVGRLAQDATPEGARSDFFGFLQHSEWSKAGTGKNAVGARVHTLSNDVVGDVRPTLVALTLAGALLLFVACLNVGILLLVRLAGRGPELAIRRALGATDRDIVKQLSAESTILAALAGALGFVLAHAFLRALIALAPSGLPRLDVIGLAAMPLAVTGGVTVLALFVFGLTPALTMARRDLSTSLRIGDRSATTTRTRRRMRQALVAGQVALAVVVLSGAGLLARSLIKLQRLDLGYATEHLSVVELAMPFAKYAGQEKLLALYDRILPQIRAVPSVTGLTPILITPFSGANLWAAKFTAEGRGELEERATPFVSLESVGPEYFGTFEVPILHGRGFTDADREGAPKVAVVSEAVARRFWGTEDPINKRIRWSSDTSASGWRTVVGVSGDIHYRELREATPTVYLPYRQFRAQGYFAIRTRGELAAVVPAIRRIVREVDADIVLWRAETMDQLLAEPLAKPRLGTFLLSTFGLAALVLAAIGLYGVMASIVRQQTREIGIRTALGATPERLRREVLGQALAMAGAGALVGVAVALAGSRLLTSLLFEVSPSDPLALVGACGLLFAVALIAAYIPARRAMRVDPMVALRTG